MLAFLQAAEAKAVAKAQTAQAEIEALAGMEAPGRRADIVDRIKQLSAQKSRYESEARYYRQAANQLAPSE
ncbi:hypothetical protein GCM10022419_016360 [Nonomuraea rosea]|uniref:Uncharacterized protein n=1 Tax=Nonomuraea rosea TaxID=638574 RepID=A0ABP6VQ15_9ACTN